MFFKWIVHLAVWFLVQAVTEKCQKGNMSSNTASQVLYGSNITLSCRLTQHERCNKIAIFHNGSDIKSIHGTEISTDISVLDYGRLVFTCKLLCDYTKKLICGIDIESGNPPDQPTNVSCIQFGEDGNPTCRWDKGRFTHINTTYMLQLSNGTDIFSFLEENVNNKYGLLDLRKKLNFESTYTAVVAASNGLGSAFSQPLTFMLIDIVKPRSPTDITVKFDNNSATNCTILWQDQQATQRFRLRYRPITSQQWTMVNWLSTRRYSLHDLKPHTEYEFQVSCRFHPSRGIWSDWSTFQTRTPEAVPVGLLDVWYVMQDIDSQRQTVTLFWKALNESKARGKILHYSVTFQEESHRSPKAAEVNTTTQTHYAKVIPMMNYNITVCAHNSKGTSPPTSISTHLNVLDLPPPRSVFATSKGNNSIFVTWEPPSNPSSFINGYVVEWVRRRHRNTSSRHHLNWIKLLASDLSTVISENIKHRACYHINVFALYNNRAGQVASTRGYSRQEVLFFAAPAAGPQVYATAEADGARVSWDEIPDHQQMGCIASYNIYLRNKNADVVPKIYSIRQESSRNSFYIKNLQQGVDYTLWMTASTLAGEGPKGNEQPVYLESASEWTFILSVCIFIVISICMCSVPCINKALCSLFSIFVPQWYSKAIPDPANSSWAKKFTSVNDELSLYPKPFLSNLSSFEEPETIEVEEVFIKRDSLAFEDQLIFNVKSNGSQDWQIGSFEKQDSAKKNSECKPLATSIADDGDNYGCQLPYLYKKLIAEETEQIQTISNYLPNPLMDTTVNYLPSNVLVSTVENNEDNSELEYNSISVFPTTSLLTPVFSCGGNLTLDAIKVDCNSFKG
ncbi:interleukin-12 receptor subunit beta-2 isoform X1 [Alligator mississippiensis]|uniref:interleukin-12 receptor subunit beta-2 isoform X1 n=1 Tax=Alligator mississippiensis TaxID=8496 RepID=UPI002877970A|nr:interleukin-12 receptor subunit beta-2 isoform X1 [Alligator mississippiensis]XP_059583907.1 interleukin-12 receptor subunit beta-2 isoform X1 [Alligator mississippiensis]